MIVESNHAIALVLVGFLIGSKKMLRNYSTNLKQAKFW